MSNPSSVKPVQAQEGDIANMGGTAPGGTVAFMSAKGDPSRLDPIVAAHMQHYGAADGAPDGSRNVPIHPGLQPGLFRTARDANMPNPDGQSADPSHTGGEPIAPSGKHRGESPEVVKQLRGSYRP
jgi:hypothetical protein